MKVIVNFTACLLLSLSGFAEPAAAAPKGLENFQLITGFHSHHDKSNGFEFRILELDGSATVAMNPIELYIVVTNNSSGDDLQSRIVVLPKVSAIEEVRFTEHSGKIQINARLARFNEDGRNHQTIAVTITVKDGKLQQVIDATDEEDQTAPSSGAAQSASGPKPKAEGDEKSQPDSE